jgi:hypothetical protein
MIAPAADGCYAMSAEFVTDVPVCTEWNVPDTAQNAGPKCSIRGLNLYSWAHRAMSSRSQYRLYTSNLVPSFNRLV